MVSAAFFPSSCFSKVVRALRFLRGEKWPRGKEVSVGVLKGDCFVWREREGEKRGWFEFGFLNSIFRCKVVNLRVSDLGDEWSFQLDTRL